MAVYYCFTLDARPYIRSSVVSFLGDNLSKYQWIFIKLGMLCTLWTSGMGLLMGKFCQFLTESSAHNTIVFGYYGFTFLLNFITFSAYVQSNLNGSNISGTMKFVRDMGSSSH